VREALHYYCRAIAVGPTFQRAPKALGRLKQLGTGTSCKVLDYREPVLANKTPAMDPTPGGSFKSS